VVIDSRTCLSARRALRRAVCATFLAAIGLGICQDARAQFAFDEEVLPPRVVAWRLADRGFTGLSRPRFDGRVYVVDAISPGGVPVRLFIDPAAGAIIGQRRLGAPEAVARLERPAPGFGWTEEDAGPRRDPRMPAPGDVPPLRQPHRHAIEATRPNDNPDAVNPDRVGRGPSPRKVARAATPVRPADVKPALRTSPEAPAPKLGPSEATKAGNTGSASPAGQGGATGHGQSTPDASPAASGTVPASAPAAAAKPSDPVVADSSKPAAQDWKDPPADKKPVRVIGGATVVPGATEKEPAAAQ
jgi:hypothetical protein